MYLFFKIKTLNLEITANFFLIMLFSQFNFFLILDNKKK